MIIANACRKKIISSARLLLGTVTEKMRESDYASGIALSKVVLLIRKLGFSRKNGMSGVVV